MSSGWNDSTMGASPLLLVWRDLSSKHNIRKNTYVALQQPQWVPSIQHLEDP